MTWYEAEIRYETLRWVVGYIEQLRASGYTTTAIMDELRNARDYQYKLSKERDQ